MWDTLCWFSLTFSVVLVTRPHIYAPSLFLSQLTDPQKSCYTAVTLIGTCHVIFSTDITHGLAALCAITLEFFWGEGGGGGLGSTATSGPDLFIVEALLSHSVGLLWMSDHPEAESST